MANNGEFAPLKNDLILRVARGERVERTPIWIMRQAGRYLPEYRDFMKDKDFFTVCRTPEYSAEITIQPVNRYALDAAIIFSDILVIPQAMGMTVEMHPGEGPVFPSPLRDEKDLDRLTAEGAEDRLQYVYDAITLTRRRLDGRVPLIGFVGAPWTLLAYMVGGSGRLFAESKRWLWARRAASHRLLDALAGVCARVAARQIVAGAQMIQVFESSAGELGPAGFREFSLPYLDRIARHLKAAHPGVPLTVFAQGAHYALGDLAATPYDVISVDWTVDPRAARAAVGAGKVLQGNLDPGVLYGDAETVRAAARDMVAAFGTGRGHVANLGHGMHPTHDPASVQAFVDAIREFSQVAEHPHAPL